MSDRFLLDPIFPPVYIGLMVLALIALAARSGMTKPLALRVIAIALLGVVFLRPVVLEPVASVRDAPVLMLLADRSLSMRTQDADLGRSTTSRWGAIAETYLDPNFIRTLREHAEVRLRVFDGTLAAIDERTMDIEPLGETSDIRAALEHAIDRLPAGSAVVLLSDGRSTSPGLSLVDIAGLAKVTGVRVHTLCVGTEAGASDVRLRAAPARELVFEGMPIELDVSISQSGYDGRRAVVRAMSPDGIRTLVSREISLSERSDILLSVSALAMEDGEPSNTVREILVRIDPLPGESQLDNNERRVFIRVTGQRIRVLVLEGAPSWESRFVVRTLAQDPQVELTTITGLGRVRTASGGENAFTPRRLVRVPGTSAQQTSQSPAGQLVDERLLSRADIIILGERIDRVMTPELARFLTARIADAGGAVIFLRVPPAPIGSPLVDELETLSAVRWTGEVDPGGRILPAPGSEGIPPVRALFDESAGEFYSSLPRMRAVTRARGARSLATLWLTDTSPDGSVRAALAHLRVGRGQTLTFMSEGMWRWALNPNPDGATGSVYRDFWARTVRWLALGGEFLPGQALSVRADRVLANPGERVRVSVRARGEEAFASIVGLKHTSPDGSARDAQLRENASDALALEAAITPLQEGVHELNLRTTDGKAQTLRFAVYDDREELRDISADPQLMADIASATGGEVLALDGRDRLLELLELESKAQQADVRMLRADAWDSPWLFALITSLLVCEWLWRRMGA